jgi:hypothetical protein
MKHFYRIDNIGTVKYTINYYDGKSKHSDGSDFFNIKTFKNKKVVCNKIFLGGYMNLQRHVAAIIRRHPNRADYCAERIVKLVEKNFIANNKQSTPLNCDGCIRRHHGCCDTSNVRCEAYDN